MATDKQHDIAAEYVLGTLQGKPRLQFEHFLRQNAAMRKQVVLWEERLFCLTEGIESVKPHKRVLKKVFKRINPERKPGLWGRIGWWRGWGIATSMLLLVMSVYIVQIEQPVDTGIPTVAILSDQSSQAGWVVKTNLDKGFMTAQALTVTDPGSNKAYELWMLPEGEAPKSLGLLPLKGKRSLALTKERLAVLRRSAALAVSLEPAGGSPTGLPTGPVLYQGKLLFI